MHPDGDERPLRRRASLTASKAPPTPPAPVRNQPDRTPPKSTKSGPSSLRALVVGASAVPMLILGVGPASAAATFPFDVPINIGFENSPQGGAGTGGSNGNGNTGGSGSGTGSGR